MKNFVKIPAIPFGSTWFWHQCNRVIVYGLVFRTYGPIDSVLVLLISLQLNTSVSIITKKFILIW